MRTFVALSALSAFTFSLKAGRARKSSHICREPRDEPRLRGVRSGVRWCSSGAPLVVWVKLVVLDVSSSDEIAVDGSDAARNRRALQKI